MTAIAPTARAPRLAPRVSPGQGLRQSFSLAWRTLVSIKHNPTELLDFSIQPVMFVLLFTFVFGGAISGSPHSYLMFALPGIIVQNTLFATMTTGVGLNTDLTKGVFDRLRKGKHLLMDEKLARLSPQEERILGLVADGLTNGQIGEELGLAEKTVKNYVSSILAKLEVARRAEAAAYLARHTTLPGSS